MTLTVADIERWDAGSVREVFHAASSRAQAAADAANGLATLPAFTNWGGVAAQAAREAIGKTRRDLDAHGREAMAVANAARGAADEIERIKSDLATLRADAESLGMEIDVISGKVLPGRTIRDPMEALLKQEQLQPRLDKIVAEANLVDVALANAIHMADGSVPFDTDNLNKPMLDQPLPRDPKEFAKFWRSLTKEQKDYLYNKDHNIGHHPGMPAGDADDPGADYYNRLNLADQLPQAEATDATASGQPTNLDEALSGIAGQPVTAPATALDRSLNQHTGSGKGDEARSTRSPLTAPIVEADPSVIDQQRARVESARQTLDAAQAKLDAAAAQIYTQGAGPSHDDTDSLRQAVFDARRELTDQTKILSDLNQAAAESGIPTRPVPALPENAQVQALPPQPSAFAEGSRALSEGSLGIIPDVAKDVDVFTNWGQHSGAEQTGAVLDAAGLVPIPGTKGVTEGIEHGLDALNAARHFDDVPAPHHIDDVAGAHASPDVPHHAADTSDTHHISDDTGHVAPYGFEDTTALLTTSEAAGGHLIERHVGQTFDDLSARLAEGPRPGTVSTFATADEASTAVSTALQHNQAAIDAWVAHGATDRLRISVPFDGGAVLVRGATSTVPGTSVLVVLQGVGNGRWIVLTGYPKP